MYLNKEDITALDKIKRISIINSITGIKPANLIGSISEKGESNLAIFSSLVHLGSNPALLGFILRPASEVRRHTWENIQENGFYTINMVPTDFIEQAHYSSAKFEKEESEFEHCRFTEEYLKDFQAPFVKESPLKIGMKFEEALAIKRNGTTLIIGSVAHLFIADEAMEAEGMINLEKLNTAGIAGLNSYYSLKRLQSFPYARRKELPDFSK